VAEASLRQTRSALATLQNADKETGGGASSTSVSVNMGSVGSKPTYFKRTTVSAAWVRSTSVLSAVLVGPLAEDAAIQQMIVTCGNLATGQFDLFVVAPHGAVGIYTVHVLGA
jgi:type IV secretory pathway VirB2 component (pilin)